MRTFKIALGSVASAVGLYFAVWSLLNLSWAMPYPVYAAALIVFGVMLIKSGVVGDTVDEERVQQETAAAAAEKQRKREFAEANHIPYKSKTAAILFALFLGFLGIHRIYLGKNSGFIFLAVSLLTIWTVAIPCIVELIALVDLISIARGEWKDKYYRDLI
jgi:TM2 domain-containing membrane protein YozV